MDITNYQTVYIDPSKCDDQTRAKLNGTIIGQLVNLMQGGELAHLWIGDGYSVIVPVDALDTQPPQLSLLEA